MYYSIYQYIMGIL